MATKRIPKPDFHDAARLKLESSGLTPEQGMALGMYSVDNAATLDSFFQGQPSLVIPYFNTEGAPQKAHPTWPQFYRIRYLGEDRSFTAATDKKPSRYTQAANTGTCAYFPQLIDWRAVRDDPSEPLLITEGELKAAKATAEGFPTIGLGGVHNFRSAKHGVFFLPELEAFNWARRKVTIVYDSDYQSNANICASINTLAIELEERGALVSLCTLDNVYDDDDKKTGLDDYLVERDSDGLIELINKAEPLGMTRRLWEMNGQLVYIRDPGFVVEQRTSMKMDPAKFTGHSDYATLSVPERKVKPDGNVSMQKSSAAAVWIKWPLRQAVDKLTYMPGHDRFYEDAKGRVLYNQWEGWGCQPVKGDITPWTELVNFIFAGSSKEERDWFLDWCAYPIQFPGTKLFSAALVYGRMTGTGKTLLGYTLAKIYGVNFRKIKAEELKDTWWAENRQFVLGDEVSSSDKRADADAMKAMITQEEININIKYVPQFSLPDCVNYYLTSNHADALFVEDEDRRYFVWEVTADAPMPGEFYRKYDKWKEGTGPSHLMHWLMQRDLSKFDPKAAPPRTAARNRMVAHSKSDVALWCSELREDPRSKLMVGQLRHQRDLFTSAELLEMYVRENGEGRVTKNGIARAMAAAGFALAYKGMPIQMDGIKSGRYFIVRNKTKWQDVKAVKELAANIKLPLAK